MASKEGIMVGQPEHSSQDSPNYPCSEMPLTSAKEKCYPSKHFLPQCKKGKDSILSAAVSHPRAVSHLSILFSTWRLF